jgi:Rod binding domain-containing protein
MRVTTVDAQAAAVAGERPGNLKEAAAAFEALFLGQMLKTARESAAGGLGEGDQAGAAMMEIAEEHLAKEMTRNGGVGLARLILAQMGSQAVSDSGANGTPASASAAIE